MKVDRLVYEVNHEISKLTPEEINKITSFKQLILTHCLSEFNAFASCLNANDISQCTKVKEAYSKCINKKVDPLLDPDHKRITNRILANSVAHATAAAEDEE